MDQNTALIWFALGVLTKRRYDVLAKRFGTLKQALEALNPSLLTELGCKGETVKRTMERYAALEVGRCAENICTQLPTPNVQRYRERMDKLGVRLVTWEDDQYPAMLRQIPDPPIFLSYCGALEILKQPCLGMVGTRSMSRYGKRVVEAFIPEIIRSGVVTVSGLALGVDAAVAQATMAEEGKTVAVLGHGLAQIYPPSHTDLALHIVASGGLLLSEFPLDVAPDKYTFPARNRIIAGLSRGVVVIEAGEGSGALITADLAMDYGRETFAVPGSVFDEHAVGCHQLLARSEATLVTSATDLLQGIGVLSVGNGSRSTFAPRNAQEATIWETLSGAPLSVGDLSERLHSDVGSIGSALTLLELAGAARNLGDGTWVRI